jgi:hypothetical protein
MVGIPLAVDCALGLSDSFPRLKNEQISICGENYALGQYIYEFK